MSNGELQKHPVLSDDLLIGNVLVILEVLLLGFDGLLGDIGERFQRVSQLLKTVLGGSLIDLIDWLQCENLGSLTHNFRGSLDGSIIGSAQQFSGEEDIETGILRLPIVDGAGKSLVPSETNSLVFQGVGFGEGGAVEFWDELGIPDVSVEGLGKGVGVDVAEWRDDAWSVEEEGRVGWDIGESVGEDLLSPDVFLIVQLGIPSLLLLLPGVPEHLDQLLGCSLFCSDLSRNLLGEPVNLAPVVGSLDVGWDGARPLYVETPHLVVSITVADVTEKIDIERRESVVSWIGIRSVVHRLGLGSSGTWLGTTLTEMDHSVASEPSHAVEDELDGLLVGKVHHEPVSEDQVNTARVHFESDGISDTVVDVSEMGVALLVLLDEAVDEVGGEDPASGLGKDGGEATDSSSDIDDILVVQLWQTGQDIGTIAGLQLLGGVVQHHRVGVRLIGVLIPEGFEVGTTLVDHFFLQSLILNWRWLLVGRHVDVFINIHSLD